MEIKFNDYKTLIEVEDLKELWINSMDCKELLEYNSLSHYLTDKSKKDLGNILEKIYSKYAYDNGLYKQVEFKDIITYENMLKKTGYTGFYTAIINTAINCLIKRFKDNFTGNNIKYWIKTDENEFNELYDLCKYTSKWSDLLEKMDKINEIRLKA